MATSTTTQAAPHDERVRAALGATFLAFAVAGVSMATWASRIPQVRDRLHLQPSELGFVLLAIAVGSLVALPLAGPIVAHVGSRRTVAAMSVLFGVGMSIAGVGQVIGVAAVVIGLFFMGFAAGAWDVAMNVHGAFVEQQLGRSIMSRFHAAFSLGTVVGALVGAATVLLHVPVAGHLVVVGCLVALSVSAGSRRFLPEHEPAHVAVAVDADAVADTGGGVGDGAGAEVAAEEGRGHFAAWREPRTLSIGAFVLAFAFAEGVGNDWIAVSVIDGRHAAKAVGSLAFATFLAAMTLGRWFGPGLLDRWGRTPVVRTLAIVGIAGTACFVLVPSVWSAFVGALAWGFGTSLGFPVGMSAGADEPAHAAGRVSVIASIGYCAFLVGPPLIGLLGDHVTVIHALLAVSVALAIAASLARVVRPTKM
jgi:MFS family permease